MIEVQGLSFAYGRQQVIRNVSCQIPDGQVTAIDSSRDDSQYLRQCSEKERADLQRFGEGLRILTDRLNSKNFYAFNPSFDKGCAK